MARKTTQQRAAADMPVLDDALASLAALETASAASKRVLAKQQAENLALHLQCARFALEDARIRCRRLMHTVPERRAGSVARIRAAVGDGLPVHLACYAEGVTEPTFHAWARRLDEGGMDALADRPRSGKPRRDQA